MTKPRFKEVVPHAKHQPERPISTFAQINTRNDQARHIVVGLRVGVADARRPCGGL